MLIDLDAPATTALGAIVTAAVGAATGIIRHLWVSLDAERRGRLEDRAAFTEAMLSAAKALREEDARENAELRAKLEAAAQPPPSTRGPTPPRRKSRQ